MKAGVEAGMERSRWRKQIHSFVNTQSENDEEEGPGNKGAWIPGTAFRHFAVRYIACIMFRRADPWLRGIGRIGRW